ncbi:uncharacterized protein LOC112100097 [Citrus clementina]|uniref:uncharacterized protein LOC112100097 n=1 Tax=Citrus clementina TaxID=85681 RepID=UPI000CED3B72|nr:uncharacterized protein LOC112100097 [Citrus x clementina]
MSQAKSRGGLGFRDLTSFNQALVAKQAWRLLQLPNSLLAKALQAKYYKHSSFLNAIAGSNPSFIWKSILWGRNKLIFERKKIEPMIPAAKAESVLEAYQRVRKTGTLHISNAREESQQRWSPSSQNVLKLKVDATTSSKDQKVGLGAVLHDSNGRVVAAGIKQASFRKDVSFAEAEAIQWGLQIVKETAAASLIVETDYKYVAELVNNTKGSRSEIFWIILEIQTQKREFQRIHFNFVPRFCNAHAHSLAKHALRKDTTAVWLDILPVEV